jgi:hypothetical protein
VGPDVEIVHGEATAPDIELATGACIEISPEDETGPVRGF